jgi:hypothetical protein
MNRLLSLALLPLLAGCSPIAAVQTSLLDAADLSLRSIEPSLEDRAALAEAVVASKRRSLDDAFDTDAFERGTADADWIVTARRAYAVALDALAEQRRAIEQSADADRRNLASARDTLRRLRAIAELQRDVLDLQGGTR